MKTYGRRIKHEEFIGTVIGDVVVVEYSHKIEKNKRFAYYYKYKCICGNEGISTKTSLKCCLSRELKNNNPTMCCVDCKKKRLSEWSKVHSVRYTDPEDAHVGTVYSNYKSRAKKKELPMDLTFQEFKNLIKMDCYFCGQKPSNLREDTSKTRMGLGLSRGKLNGLDRIDSDDGYTKDNVLPCCEDCNKAKRNLPLRSFLEMIKNIYENLELSRDTIN